jgi:hypothetical protein
VQATAVHWPDGVEGRVDVPEDPQAPTTFQCWNTTLVNAYIRCYGLRKEYRRALAAAQEELRALTQTLQQTPPDTAPPATAP